MKRISAFLFFALLIIPVCVAAKDLPPDEMFKKNFPGRNFESITPAAIPGVYEVYTGNQLYYYVPETNVLIYGNIVSKEGVNLTRESYLKKIAPKMAQLPVESALKIGEGKITVIEFIDPDCFHCRESYKYFSRRKDVTIYVFFYPLSQLSERKIRHILCAPDQQKAYEEALGGALDNNKVKLNDCQDKKAEETLKTHKRLAAQIGIRSTPFFYLKGQAIDGFELPVMEQILKR